MTTPNRADKEGGRALIEVTPELLAKLRQPRVVLAIVFALAGAVAEFIGYWGVSGTLDTGKQLPYLISGGVGGIFLLGAAAMLFFSADLGSVRDEVRDVRALVESVSEDVRHLRATLDGGTTSTSTSARKSTSRSRSRST